MRRPGGSAHASVFVVAATALMSLIMAAAAGAATFTVNSTGDGNDLDYLDRPTDGRCDADGSIAGRQCTLRAAVQEANATRNPDAIEFDILGGGVKTITPASPLLATKKVTINGYTQPGAAPNTLTDPTQTNATIMIQLTGANSGVRFSSEESSGSVVKGLSITGCGSSCGWALAFQDGEDHRAQGNFLGVSADGVSGTPNVMGVAVSQNVSGVKIGGGKPGARNLISNNTAIGVYLNAAQDTVVKGNLIGLDRNGNALGNGTPPPPTGAIRGGIAVGSDTGNSLLSNSIYDTTGLGINLLGGNQDSNGVNINDGDDPATTSVDPDRDTGSNRLQNHPVLTGAQLFQDPFGDTALGGGTLESVRSTPQRQEKFVIQLFLSPTADASGHGEGRMFVGQQVVTTDQSGDASFNFSVGGGVEEGDFITATATRKRTGDTSEFSNARIVTAPVIGP